MDQHPGQDGTWSLIGFEAGTSYSVQPQMLGFVFDHLTLPFDIDKATNLNFTGNKQ